MANPIVIDISHHQPDPIDWQQVRAGGTVGVIHKATQGTGFVDEDLFERAKAATDAGLCWSTYHFLTAADPEQQMAFYLNTIHPVKGERVCIDHEEDASLDQLKAAVQYILDYRPDLQITIYSGHLIEEQLQHGRDDFLAGNTSLWTAQYTDRASEVDWADETWPVPSLWQYSQSESVSGIDGSVDGNKWNGSKEALVKWFGPADTQPLPQPDVPSITADVTVDGDVDFRLIVNGVLVWETEPP